jgi:hypothetical protein
MMFRSRIGNLEPSRKGQEKQSNDWDYVGFVENEGMIHSREDKVDLGDSPWWLPFPCVT